MGAHHHPVLRDDVDWLADASALAGTHALAHAARETLDDLVHHTRRLGSEVEHALSEWVAAGLVTADGGAASCYGATCLWCCAEWRRAA